ncbi:MAG: pyruvate kinase [Anaerolineae bacterium]
MRRTKIVATIGPATASHEQIAAMIAAGMNVARLNFSHGSYDDHRRTCDLVRAAADQADQPVAILQDLQGPKMRTGRLIDGQPVELEQGARLEITTDDIAGDARRISTDYPHLPRDVSPGDHILVSDGLIELRVLKTTDTGVLTEVVYGGILRPRQGVNLPGVTISMPSVTAKDLNDLEFGVGLGVDYVALSFVRHASDVVQAKEALARADATTPVIAKLERPEALDELDAILAVADGLMVARGDLGVEIAPERVPGIQKTVIRAANRAGKPVITATQMLESMISSPQPTRAEVSDVANAILDGSDAVMLSGETAIGKYPIRAIQMMVRIAAAVEEQAISGAQAALGYPLDELSSIPQGIAAAVSALVRTLPLTAICVVTRTGSTARLVSRYRPALPILAFTPLESTYRQLSLLWGVIPIKTEFVRTEQAFDRQVRTMLLERGYAQPSDRVVVTGGYPVDPGGPTNMIRVLPLEGTL